MIHAVIELDPVLNIDGKVAAVFVLGEQILEDHNDSEPDVGQVYNAPISSMSLYNTIMDFW